MSNWKEIKTKAISVIRDNNLPIEYAKRLKYEIKEIEKQGANKYWVDKFIENKCIDSNKNGLVLPFLLKLTSVDPIKTSFVYVEEKEGKSGEIISIILENGKIVNIPGALEVLLKDGTKKLASQLEIGDDLY